jgi:6-pyruvoyltetrahydropterin/6-carboxytetrahydropterin synthase
VKVRFHFDAAHRLEEYSGKCEEVHGHRWEVVVCLKAEETDSLGIAYDFNKLRSELSPLFDELDHTNLNNSTRFGGRNLTAEEIARMVYSYAQDRFASDVVTEKPQNPCTSWVPGFAFIW